MRNKELKCLKIKVNFFFSHELNDLNVLRYMSHFNSALSIFHKFDHKQMFYIHTYIISIYKVEK